MILHDIKLLISQSLMNAYGDQIIKLGTVCLFIKFETAKCFTTFLCRDHISVMLEFHTQMTAHNRVHYCTFLIVSLITPLGIDGMVWWFFFIIEENRLKILFLWSLTMSSLSLRSLTHHYCCLPCRHTVKTLLLCNLFPHIFFFLSFFWHRIFFVSSLEHFSSCLI